MRKEDAGRLIAAADGKLKLLLVFLFSQGWRIGDALRLQWADINLNEATVWYRISKTDEAMPMPLNLSLLDMLRDEPQPRVGRVFPWRGKSKSLLPHSAAVPKGRDFLHATHGKTQFCDLAPCRGRFRLRNNEGRRVARP